MEEIAGPCDILKMTQDDLYNENEPRVAESEGRQADLLASLKELKDEADTLSVTEFASQMRS